MRDSVRRRRAAAWALALWLVAAAGLGVARAMSASEVWIVGAGLSVEGSPPTPADGGADRSDVSRHARNDKPKRSKPRSSKERALRAKRQRLALAVGHSLPVPVEKAPRYKLDNRHHDYPALDLLVRHGTPVRAVTAGRVRDITKAGACGRGVIVKGKDGLTYTYCHGNKLLVREGERVPAGETIMKSGNTGNSSAPHLHLQVASKRGRLLCPQHMLSRWQKGKELPGWKVGRSRCVR